MVPPVALPHAPTEAPTKRKVKLRRKVVAEIKRLIGVGWNLRFGVVAEALAVLDEDAAIEALRNLEATHEDHTALVCIIALKMCSVTATPTPLALQIFGAPRYPLQLPSGVQSTDAGMDEYDEVDEYWRQH